MPGRTLRHSLATVGVLLLVGLSCYSSYRAGQRHGLPHRIPSGVSETPISDRVAQRPKASGITLHAEQDEDGPFIVVAIPWRTLCASGLTLPQQEAADCAEAKESNIDDVTYTLPTDDGGDEDDGPGNNDGALPVVSLSTGVHARLR
jgi:hypothetical protein